MQNNNDYDALMARLNATKPVTDRDPFMTAGEHDLIVWAIETYNDAKWGQSVRVICEVEKSITHPIGARVVKTYNLFKPSEFPTQATDADEFAKFVCVLQGIPEGQHGPACRALLKSRAEGGNMEGQPARGARIHASGRPPKAGINPKTNKPYSYVKVTWTTIPQDGNMIQATRAQLDARGPYQASPQYVPQPAPQVQNPQAQQFVQQYAQPAAPAATPAPAVAPAGGFLSMLPPNGGR
jgi:hypothetical protein